MDFTWEFPHFYIAMILNLTYSSLGQAIVSHFVEKEPHTSVKANYSILGVKVSTPVIFVVLSIYFFNLFFDRASWAFPLFSALAYYSIFL